MGAYTHKDRAFIYDYEYIYGLIKLRPFHERCVFEFLG